VQHLAARYFARKMKNRISRIKDDDDILESRPLELLSNSIII